MSINPINLLALRLCFCLSLGLCLGLARAQEIIGMHGADIGGIEPWDIPMPEAALDTGLARRIAELAYPCLLRMDARESLLGGSATNVWLEPERALDSLEEMQPELGRDVLSVAALLRKHAAEIEGWGGGIASNLAAGAQWTEAALSQALNTKPGGGPAPDPAARRHWIAAAWAPLAAGLDLTSPARETASALGLAPASHAPDPAWSWLAFLAALRRSAADADARIYAAPSLQALLRDLQTTLVVPYALGDLAAPELFHERMEALIGCRAVAGLFQPELLDRWILEGGDFVYDAFCAQAGGAVRAALDGAVLASVLSDGFVWQERGAEAVAAGCDVRAARYTVLAAELRVRQAGEPAGGMDAARLYSYYLMLLARFPPCLSPFRIEQVNANWLRCVEEKIALGADTAGLRPESPEDDDPPPMPALCLLQSDAWRDGQGLWHWRPRAAGRRHYLDQYLRRPVENTE